jgi:hypothetical protein
LKSRTQRSFWRLYAALPSEIRAQARAAYTRFMTDPGHPSLRFKKLAGRDNVWSVRIGADYRAVARRSGDTVEWFWIGTHNDFDKVF